MGKLDFVDTHVHYYDMHHPDLFYGHWQPDVDHPFLGAQTRKLGERNFIAEDYIALTRNANVFKAVHVQAAIGSQDPHFPRAGTAHVSHRTRATHALDKVRRARPCSIPEIRSYRNNIAIA